MKFMNNHYGVSRIFGRAHCVMPMNLQFFAEPDGGAGGGAGGAGGGGASGNAGGTGAEPGAAGGEGAAGQGAEGGTGQAAGSPMSFDDFLKDPKNQAEFDRRVSKALETSRSKMQAEINTKVQEAVTEAEKMAKMNAEQKAQYEREKKEKEMADREAAITKRELMATAKEQLAEKGLPLSLADVLNYSSAEECNASIEAIGKTFQEAVEKAVEDRLKGGKPPKKAGDKAVYTMEQIKAMSPAEINQNWDAVQAAMQATK